MEEERKQMTDEERQTALLEYWVENRDTNPTYPDERPELLRSVDIFDQLADMEEIPLCVINEFLLARGFSCTTIADGSVRWKVYGHPA